MFYSTRYLFLDWHGLWLGGLRTNGIWSWASGKIIQDYTCSAVIGMLFKDFWSFIDWYLIMQSNFMQVNFGSLLIGGQESPRVMEMLWWSCGISLAGVCGSGMMTILIRRFHLFANPKLLTAYHEYCIEFFCIDEKT